ncbi:LPS assembly lipoprotein LptE [Thermodesulfobacteriota bacterium B35]
MRILPVRLIILLCLVVLLGGCGYYFPQVYDGPTRYVYMPTWKNRTNELGLDARIYQSLARWFQKSDAIRITKDKKNADLILAGEILYIDLPSVSWNGDARSTSVKVKLGVRYVLKDLKKDKILWEVPDELWTEDYSIHDIGTNAETKALAQIVDDLSERIYLGTLDKLREQNKRATK